MRAALDGLPEMAGVTHRDVLSRRVDAGQLPERSVTTPLERISGGAVGQSDRFISVEVVVRRKGASAVDILDADSMAIEAATLPILLANANGGRADLTMTQVEADQEGSVQIAELRLRFEVLRYTAEGAAT